MLKKSEIAGFVGRRKTAVARVYLTQGKGVITVNGFPYDKFFSFFTIKDKILKSFIVTDCLNKYDANINVRGGGINAQAEAICLGLARCLASVDTSYKSILSSFGLLTRDDRVVESKKAGKKKARKSFQFCKR